MERRYKTPVDQKQYDAMVKLEKGLLSGEVFWGTLTLGLSAVSMVSHETKVLCVAGLTFGFSAGAEYFRRNVQHDIELVSPVNQVHKK